MGFFKSSGKRTGAKGGKTIIASGCVISGEFSELSGAMHVDGRIDGRIESGFDLSIGTDGVVKGYIKARTTVLSGVLEGKVACERIDILASGKLIGELISGEMTVEAGGKFIGESRELTEGGLIVSLPDDLRSTPPASLTDSSQALEEGESSL